MKEPDYNPPNLPLWSHIIMVILNLAVIAGLIYFCIKY